tara:strand:+ start:50 stop:1228 length:1179 start_codon:yes stop_codon:yes gene_type:complete
MDRLDLLREKIRRVAQDPDVDDKKGTQPKKYYSGVKKDKKDARDAHFKRGASMSDDNPAAYKPAPGDKDPKTGKLKKTKPSKHTKKFKAMYGEEINEVTFGNPNATELDALPPKVVNRFVKEYNNADKLQTLVIRTRSKIRGSEQRETLDDLNKKVRDFKFALSDCIETGSTIVMDYTLDGDDLHEGKLVTGVADTLDVITKRLKKEMGARYKKNAESGLKFINSVAKLVGMTASDKGQQKNRMFLRMSEETLDEKAPNTADAMKRHKAGKAGFTDKAHLKAKGLIPRSDGTKRKSPKYEAKILPKVKKKLDKIKGITKQQAEILASIPSPTLMSIIQQLSTLTMELDPKKDDAGDYIDDFRKSDAPQFKGKSDAKIRKMAIAAYLDAKDKK